MDSYQRDKLENLRAFLFSEHQQGKIGDDTFQETIRIIDEILSMSF